MRALVAACAILLVPSVSAASAAFEAESVAWTGARQLAGDLVALRYVPDEPQPWQLNATVLHVDVVQTDLHVLVPGVAWADTEPRHIRQDYQNASLQGHETSQDHFLYAWPLGAVNLRAGCATDVQPDPSPAFQVPDQVQRPNPNPSVPTDHMLQGQTCSSVELCGHFRLAFWSWKADGQHDGGAFTVETGRTGPTADSLAPSSAAQAYLDVEDGCLILAPGTDILANALQLVTANLQLHNAAGLLDGLPAAGRDVQLEGSFQALLHRGNGTEVTIPNGIQRAVRDGEVSLATVQASPTSGLGSWPLLSAALLLLAAAVVFVQIRRALRRRHALPIGPGLPRVPLSRRQRRQLLALTDSTDSSDKRVPRPYTADEPKATVKFTGDDRKQVVNAVRAGAMLEGRKLPDFLQYLVRLGLQEHLRRKQEK